MAPSRPSLRTGVPLLWGTALAPSEAAARRQPSVAVTRHGWLGWLGRGRLERMIVPAGRRHRGAPSPPCSQRGRRPRQRPQAVVGFLSAAARRAVLRQRLPGTRCHPNSGAVRAARKRRPEAPHSAQSPSRRRSRPSESWPQSPTPANAAAGTPRPSESRSVRVTVHPSLIVHPSRIHPSRGGRVRVRERGRIWRQGS